MVDKSESKGDLTKRLLKTVNDEYLEAQCSCVLFEATTVGRYQPPVGCECLIAVGELTMILTGHFKH